MLALKTCAETLWGFNGLIKGMAADVEQTDSDVQ